MKNILEWIISSLTSIFLTLIFFVVGLILTLYGLYINIRVNDVGAIIAATGFFLILASIFILPIYFLIRGLIKSVKELSSKEMVLRATGLISIILIIIFSLSSYKQIFSFIEFVSPFGLYSSLLFLLLFSILFLMMFICYYYIIKFLKKYKMIK